MIFEVSWKEINQCHFFTRSKLYILRIHALSNKIAFLLTMSIRSAHHPTSSSARHGKPLSIQIFTSEGAYYWLNLKSKHVEWYKSLGSSLLRFERSHESQPPSYLIPTLDGHFLYIDRQA